jgi:hypothetical protein
MIRAIRRRGAAMTHALPLPLPLPAVRAVLASAIVALGLPAGASAAGAASAYRYLPLTWPGAQPAFTSMNASGAMAGTTGSVDAQGGRASGLVARADGRTTLFRAPGAMQTQANAINVHGDVAGQWGAAGAGLARGFVRRASDGRLLDLFPDVPGGSTDATGIERHGEVVGFQQATDSAPTQAFAWQSGVTTWLPDLGGSLTQAWAVNDGGTIVGDATDAAGLRHAVRWVGGALQLLPALPGVSSPSDAAVAINTSGLSVGNCTGLDGQAEACGWDADGNVIDYGRPAGSFSSYADAVDDQGHVVGLLLDGVFEHHAVMFVGGGAVVDLQTRVDPPTTDVLVQAIAIDHGGTILVMTAVGGYGLLVPVGHDGTAP